MMTSAKTITYEAVVLHLDDEDGVFLYEGAEVHFENPVPVLNSESKRVGAATLSVDGKAVKAEMVIDRDSPEHKAIMGMTPPTFAHINAFEAMDNSEGRWRCASTNIVAIDLDPTPTPDNRIPPLK